MVAPVGGMRGCSGGCVVAPGGHAWLLRGVGACVVAPRGVCVVALRGHTWLLGGACVVALGGVWLLRGACVVALGGGMCGFIWGGMHGFIQGGMHGFIQGGMHGFFSFFRYNEIQSMSGQYASYWNAFLLVHVVDTKALDKWVFWLPSELVHLNSCLQNMYIIF